MINFIKNLKKDLEEIRKNRPDHVPYKQCRGFLDWFSKNEGTRQRYWFDCFISGLVAMITTILINKYR